RCRTCRARDGRWLHHRHRPVWKLRAQRRDLSASVRLAKGFRAHCTGRQQSAGDCHQVRHAGEGFEGIDRVAEGKSCKASQGTAGAGSPAHVSGIYFQNVTGTKFQFVPYRGAAPAMQDLVAGQIDLMIDQASNALQQVRAGRIKAYAVTANARLPGATDIPTVDEAGLPGFYVPVWHGVWAPKATPSAVVAQLNAALVDALANPNVRQRLAELGQGVPARDEQTPEALRAYQQSEANKWWPIIKAANIKPE